MMAGVVFAVSSCCNCGKVVSTKGGALTGGQWQLVQMDGRAIVAENDAYTLTFAGDGKVSGKGDCNRVSGPFESDSKTGTISFGAMVSTRMMCPNQAQEDAYLKTLGTINSYAMDGRILTLFSNGEQKLIFEKK